MKPLFILLTILFCGLQLSYAQQNETLSTGRIDGTVRDAGGQPIPLVSIRIPGEGIATESDRDGRFSLSAPAGRHTLQVSRMGFDPQEREVLVKAGETQNIHFTLNGGSSELDQIIVSASRNVESLSETPSSVTVLDAEGIKSFSTLSPNLGNIVGYAVPGLGSATNNTGNYGQTLRGRNMLVLIDGIPQSTPLKTATREIRSIDPSVIGRVEVIKGATAIYGNGADGGLINYITKRPPMTQQKIGGYSQAGLTGNTKGDSTLGYRFSQQLYGTLDKFDYVVSGLYEKTGVFRDADAQVISPEYGLGETNIYNAFAKLGYNFSDQQRLELMYNYYSSNQASDFVLQEGVYGERPALGVRGNRMGEDEGTRYNHNATLRYTHEKIFGNTNLAANIYLQDFYTVFSYSTFFYEGGQSATGSAKKGLRVNLNSPFILSSAISGDVTYGFDLLHDNTHQTLTDGRVWVPHMKMYNIAPYAQLSTQWFKNLIIKAGLRAENIQVNIDDYNTLAKGPDGEGSIAVAGGKLNYDALVFNAGARYTRWKHFNPFISYSQAFSIFDLGRVLTAAEENTISKLETEPVIVNNYEGGFSSQLGKLNLSAAYYHSTSKLGSNTIKTEEGLFIAERLPVRIWGYEVQAGYQVIDELSLGANYAYVEGRGDKDDDGDFYGGSDVYLKSNRITPVKATAYARYRHQGLNIGLYWMYIGNRDHFEARENGTYAIGEGPIRSYNLWNLSARYQINPQLQVSLGLENLLNTDYYPTASQFYGTSRNYTPGNGRRFNLSVGYRF